MMIVSTSQAKAIELRLQEIADEVNSDSTKIKAI